MSEFRKDIVSGDWIVMAPERDTRPHDRSRKKSRKPSPVKSCPFEKLDSERQNWPPVMVYPNLKKWRMVLLPNKFPALINSGIGAHQFNYGPYLLKDGAGYHDIIITRNHHNNYVHLDPSEAYRVLWMMQERYKYYAEDKYMSYTSAFFNWGSTAGASVYHPHYQLLALPIIPPDVTHSLNGSERYYKKHHRCVHCEMLRFEKKQKLRIVMENDQAIALAPFVSRSPYEVRIFPKKHLTSFEFSKEKEVRGVSAILQQVLFCIEKNLRDPDLNVFIHTSPLRSGDKYRYYHWHLEIIPKIGSIGGFELSTGLEINTVLPEKVAMTLRKSLT